MAGNKAPGQFREWKSPYFPKLLFPFIIISPIFARFQMLRSLVRFDWIDDKTKNHIHKIPKESPLNNSLQLCHDHRRCHQNISWWIQISVILWWVFRAKLSHRCLYLPLQRAKMTLWTCTGTKEATPSQGVSAHVENSASTFFILHLMTQRKHCFSCSLKKGSTKRSFLSIITIFTQQLLWKGVPVI